MKEGIFQDSSIAGACEERQLTPEAAESALETLESIFRANDHLHQGLEWSRVESALKADTEALWSVSQMEAKGHEPDIYNIDDGGFDIGTCVLEVPQSTRNSVYDSSAAEWVKDRRPGEKFNGMAEAMGAVEMAEAMGLVLMNGTQYFKYLFPKFNGFIDRYNSTRLLEKRFLDGDDRNMICKAYFGGFPVMGWYFTVAHDPNWGWRGTRRVKWA